MQIRRAFWKTCFLAISLFISTVLTPAIANATLAYSTFQSDGATVLVITGEFSAEDNTSIFLQEVIGNSAKLVTFNSSGGNPYKAMEMGREIRKLGIATVQLRSSQCDSACALAFMGGQFRFSEPGAIGVHRTSFTDDYSGDRNSAAIDIQVVTKDILSYMIEMGIDPALMEILLQYDSNDIRHLSGSEMARYRVTNTNDLQPARQNQVARPSIKPANDQFPKAVSGLVRHPRGHIELKAGPDSDTNSLALLPNGTPVKIVGNSNRWYGVKSTKASGFAHHTWIKIDQFVPTEFDERFIQIKSFAEKDNAMRYATSSATPLSVYVASNGWFAVTLPGTKPEKAARNELARLKGSGAIPEDSFITYGNTYVNQICCN